MAILLGIVAVVLLIVALISIVLNVMFCWKFPFILKGLFAQRFVFFCGIDGTLRPVPGKVEGYGVRTAEGTYNFEREDVVTFFGIPSIIVYRPIAKAIRPNIAPVFRKLKKAGIKNRSQFESVLDSKPMSKEEFMKEMEVAA